MELTWPRTKPSLRKRMTEKMDRMQGMVTPNTIVSFFCLAGGSGREEGWEEGWADCVVLNRSICSRTTIHNAELAQLFIMQSWHSS